MKSRTYIFLILLGFSYLWANDGAYKASGNHLIPIHESEISVKKEILKITRVNEGYVSVDVYYEFYNPGDSKTLLVGFEAPSPSGDVDGTPINGRHPYMDQFTVILNDQTLPFQVSMVKDSNYIEGDKVAGLSESDILNDNFDPNFPMFYYVYHFEATFQPGLNVIQHTYRCELSSSVMEHYSFDYILTAANRWANEGIDDFTLMIDMGPFEKMRIAHTFFNGLRNWRFVGKGEYIYTDQYARNKSSTSFYTKDGLLTFQQKNFHPKGELSLYSVLDYSDAYLPANPTFDYSEIDLPFTIKESMKFKTSKDEISFKILRNLPYARRGYIFKTPEINEYYRKMSWYNPDSSYVASLDDLTAAEAAWLKIVRDNGGG